MPLGDFFEFDNIEQSFFKRVISKDLPTAADSDLMLKGLKATNELFPENEDYVRKVLYEQEPL